MREIKLKITLEGGKSVEAGIDSIGDGLNDLATRDARAAKQALDALDRATFRNLQNEVRRAKAGLEEWGSQIQKLGQGMTNFGSQLSLYVTAPLAAAGALAAKSFANVELAVAKISSIKPEIDTSQLIRQLEDMSTRVPQTAEQLGDGLYNIFSSIEITQGEAVKLLEQFAKGATAAQTDAQTFGTAVLGVLNAYKLGVEESAHVTDVFFNTVNLGVVNGQELASSLGEVTQAAKNAGVGFDELGALIVGVTKEGGSASQNINNLSNFLQKLPTKESSAALAQLGVSIKDADGNFRPAIAVLGDLKKQLDGLTPSARALALQEIFPDAQARAGAQTLISQLDTVKQAFELNVASAGAAEKAYGKIAVTMSVQFALLKNSAVAILSSIGAAILPAIQPVIIWIAQVVVPAVKEAVDAFQLWSPELRTVAVGIAAFVAALGPALVVVGTLVTAIGGVVAAISSISAGIAALGGLSAIAPVVAGVAVVIAAFIAQVTALGLAAYGVYVAWQENFGGLRDLTDQVWNSVTTVVEAAMVQISALVADIGGDIVSWWRENYPLIQATVANVSARIAVITQSFLSQAQAFWETHGEDIVAIVKAAWSIISTVIRTGVSLVLQSIRLIMQIVNGDWAGAWATAKDNLVLFVAAIGKIMVNLHSIVARALKALVVFVISTTTEIYQKAIDIGTNLVLGLIDGMGRLKDRVILTAKSIIDAPLSIFRDEPQIKSPSRVTTEIGEYLGEGLAVGMENSEARVRGTARKLIAGVIKDLKDAQKEFLRLAGASPETQSTIVETDRLNDAARAQKEIISLRSKLGINTDQALPTDPTLTMAELNLLKEKAKAADDLAASYDEIAEGVQRVQAGREEYQKTLDQIQQSGDLDLLNLREQIELTGTVDELEQQRIKNSFELQRQRIQLQNDGYGEAQIDEILEITQVEQARRLELQRILAIRKQVSAASDLKADLNRQLGDLQNGNRQLTEYEQTLRRINTTMKDLSPEQKKQLLDLAKQIDLQREYNEQYERTFDLVRNVFDVLTDTSRSWGDKLRTIFGGILQSFRKMILDMTAAWLTSKIMKSIGGGTGSGSGSSSGGWRSILGQLLGGGSGGGGGIFGGGGLMGSGTTLPGIGGRGGGGIPTLPDTSGIPVPNPGRADAGAGSRGGLGLAGGLALGGTVANMLGGLIGGRAGSFLSNIGGGVAMGAQIGSIIPGIGTAVGAIIGGGIGLIQSILGGDPKRRRDKKEKLPALNQAFADALQQLRELVNTRAIFDNPDGALARAQELRGEIASGFGIVFESGKYRRESQAMIAAKLVEADQIIEQIKRLRDRSVRARDVDRQLGTASFAGGVYMSPEFRGQFDQFRRRNGMLPGRFDGRDTLPSLLARGEMVLNPRQIGAVIANAGRDVFQGAGIPGYSGGTATAPSVSSGSGTAQQIVLQPNITVVIEGEGMTDAKVRQVLMNGLKNDSDVKVQLVRSYDSTKPRDNRKF